MNSDHPLYYEVIRLILNESTCIKSTFTLILADKKLYNRFLRFITGYDAIIIKYYLCPGHSVYVDIILQYKVMIRLPRVVAEYAISFWLSEGEYDGVTLNVVAESEEEIIDSLLIADDILRIVFDKCIHNKYQKPVRKGMRIKLSV